MRLCLPFYTFGPVIAFSVSLRVKNLKTVLLLLMYLVSVTEFTQVLKLPVLLSHYIEHVQKEKTHSFLDFLNDHYFDDDGETADDDTDRRLPFKKPGSTELDPDILPLLSTISIEPCSFIANTFPIDSGLLLSSRDIPSIWLPPKLA